MMLFYARQPTGALSVPRQSILNITLNSCSFKGIKSTPNSNLFKINLIFKITRSMFYSFT